MIEVRLNLGQGWKKGRDVNEFDMYTVFVLTENAITGDKITGGFLDYVKMII